MKKSFKVFAFAMVLTIGLLALTGCGNNAKSDDKSSTSNNDKGTTSVIKNGKNYDGSIIKATLPNGWILKAGKDIDTVGYVDDADYIIKGNDVDTSAPTLQISLAKQATNDIDNWKGWIEEGSYGEANKPFTINDITWYTAKEGGVALIDGKVCLVFNMNGANFTDKEIQDILGNISWK